MQFSQCIGQNNISKHLIKSAQSGKVPHAQLFISKPGGGGLALALAFAQYLNCEHQGDGESCGNCSSCLKMQKLMHPDVVFTFPTVKQKGAKKPPLSVDYIADFRKFVAQSPYADEQVWLETIDSGTSQGNITANECLEIIKSVKLKPLEGKYKVNIIWKPERMGKEGNRLLKVIEEPPENTIFLLVAEEEDLILNTILSRCQTTRLQPVGQVAMKDFLVKNGLDESKANQLALISEGNIHEALSQIENQEKIEENLMADWLSTILKNKAGLVAKVEHLGGMSKEVIKNLFLQGTQLSREALILHKSSLPTRFNEAEEKIARWLGRRLDIDEIYQLNSVFEEGFYAIGRNANLKLLLMSSSLKIDDIIRQREVVNN